MTDWQAFEAESINLKGDAMDLQEARQIAAQCWCDEETRDIEMDSRLAEAFSKRLQSATAHWQAELERLRGLVEKWQSESNDCFRNGDKAAAWATRHCADELSAVLQQSASEQRGEE